MTFKIVQIAGDDAADANAYTGPPREIRVDTDNWNLRVHDGSTPGGHVVLNEEETDSRYIQLTAEAGAIGPFSGATPGLLCRIGHLSYALRSLVDDGDGEITITNPNGVAGNISLGVADVFTRNKTFNAGAQGAFAGAFVGDVDVSTDTFVCGANQIQVAWINSTQLKSFINANALWVGAILMSATLASIPTNWHICDGTGGTPDLRDKFIIGSGGSHAIGATGGSTSQTVTVAGHAITIPELPLVTPTVNDPTHYHGVSDGGHAHSVTDPTHFHSVSNVSGGNGRASGGLATMNFSPGTFDTDAASTGISIDGTTTGVSIQTSTTGISIDAFGGGAAHSHSATGSDNQPPYYALAMYMRTS